MRAAPQGAVGVVFDLVLLIVLNVVAARAPVRTEVAYDKARQILRTYYVVWHVLALAAWITAVSIQSQYAIPPYPALPECHRSLPLTLCNLVVASWVCAIVIL
jgi:hypothetical protein